MSLKEKMNSQVARNSLWLMLLRVFNTIVPVFTLPYITRILSKSAYGEFSVSLSWVIYFQVVVEYGFGFSGAKRVATRNNDKEVNAVFSNIIFSRLFLLLLCFVAFVLIVTILDISRNQIVAMAILSLMVLATVFQQTWFFQGISEMKNITIISVISRITSLVLTFLLIKGPEDLYLYCFLYVLNFLTASSMSIFLVLTKYKVRFTACKMSNIFYELKEGWALFISTAMGTIFGTVGVTILSLFATSGELGAYAAIHKVPYVLTIFFSAISQALYPNSCKVFVDGFKKGVSNVMKYAVPSIVFFALGGVVLIIFKNPIIKIAFGKEYVSDAMLLVPFVIWSIIGIINNFLGIQILVASGHQREYSLSFVISMCFMIVLMFALGSWWKAMGVVLASMISEGLLMCLLSMFIGKIKREGD